MLSCVLMDIDWEKQWELHAPDFFNGCVHVKSHGFRLKPGPGFGDLSHPTTRLMLASIPKKISLPVIDIGCGSGVLALAAYFSGASKVYGIDIDEKAIIHAKKNAKLNKASIYLGKTLPMIPEACLVLMNMISSEQKVAWQQQKDLLPHVNIMIVSGILTEDRHHFLRCTSYGTMIEEQELEGWMSFKYKNI